MVMAHLFSELKGISKTLGYRSLRLSKLAMLAAAKRVNPDSVASPSTWRSEMGISMRSNLAREQRDAMESTSGMPGELASKGSPALAVLRKAEYILREDQMLVT